VLNYITEILLGLNFIGVLYLIFRRSTRQDAANEPENQQAFLVKQQQVLREISELRLNVEGFHQTLKREIQHLRAERKAFEASLLVEKKSKQVENLFLNDRYKEIFDLQQQGFSVEEIANKLEKGHGEVAFILQLAVQERN
jgi:cbb3-type cytochrome oxidase subunit 3